MPCCDVVYRVVWGLHDFPSVDGLLSSLCFFISFFLSDTHTLSLSLTHTLLSTRLRSLVHTLTYLGLSRPPRRLLVTQTKPPTVVSCSECCVVSASPTSSSSRTVYRPWRTFKRPLVVTTPRPPALHRLYRQFHRHSLTAPSTTVPPPSLSTPTSALTWVMHDVSLRCRRLPWTRATTPLLRCRGRYERW